MNHIEAMDALEARANAHVRNLIPILHEIEMLEFKVAICEINLMVAGFYHPVIKDLIRYVPMTYLKPISQVSDEMTPLLEAKAKALQSRCELLSALTKSINWQAEHKQLPPVNGELLQDQHFVAFQDENTNRLADLDLRINQAWVKEMIRSGILTFNKELLWNASRSSPTSPRKT